VKPTFRINAASLIYAILLILLISSISLSLILLNQYRLNYVNGFINENRLIDNSYSAANQFCGLKFRNENYHWKGDLFKTGMDSVEVDLYYHGIFRVNSIRSFNQNISFYNACFSGSFSLPEYGLQIENSRYELKVAGSTRLRGGLIVPQKTIERAFIKNQNYNGDKLFWGNIKESPRVFPMLNKATRNRISKITSLINKKKTSNAQIFNPFDSIIAPFHLEQQFFKDTGIIAIENTFLKGNIIVVSEKEVHLFANSKLENVVIIAPIIRVENGFNGSAQFIASDSLIIGEDVSLNFPSALIATTQESKETYIIINKNTTIEGLILANKISTKSSCNIEIMDGGLINGWIYNPGAVIIKNVKIHGQLTCKSVIYKNKGGKELNLLLNVEIDPAKMPYYIKGMNFLMTDGKKEIVEWL
jgi:hypothetical protein